MNYNAFKTQLLNYDAPNLLPMFVFFYIKCCTAEHATKGAQKLDGFVSPFKIK